MQVVYIDQKKFYLNSTGDFLGWGISDEADRVLYGGAVQKNKTVTTPFKTVSARWSAGSHELGCACVDADIFLICMQGKLARWCIYYYAAVNWFTGAVYIKLMSGTVGTGFTTEYKVCYSHIVSC